MTNPPGKANIDEESRDRINEVLDRIDATFDLFPELTVGEVIEIVFSLMNNILSNEYSTEKMLHLSHTLHDCVYQATEEQLNQREANPEGEIPGGNEEVIN
jgi:hypothetical protein